MYSFNALVLLSALPLVLSRPAEGGVTVKTRQEDGSLREKTNIDDGWRFMRSEENPDGLSYDDLKPWILPCGNDFINDPAGRHERPDEDPDIDVPYIADDFDDSEWELLNLPHDWAIKGPFYTEEDSPVSGGMGRLPSQGVGWYRRKISISSDEEDQSTYYLDVDGAMSYSMVWLNGKFVGGWPYGYNSFRLDLTPHLKPGDDNQLAIRLDNALDSSRWYPGAGLYRNIWLTKITKPVRIGHWGTFITTKDVSAESATLDLAVQVENQGNENESEVRIETDVYTFDPTTGKPGDKVIGFPPRTLTPFTAGQKVTVSSSVTLENPRLWGPPPTQEPNLYVAVTRVSSADEELDSYETRFGIRSVVFDPENGPVVNGERIRFQGVNQHHDLGSLGAAFNVRAAERQMEMLQEMGCNALRTSHNPPAPELLEITDRMGFLVIDEIFDVWELEKTERDFHLIFPDWHEPDLRTMLRRDRNHPSIIVWSVGNEVGEQRTGEDGAAIARMLRNMVREEDTTRPVTASMNFAQASDPFPAEFDILSLNYQGEGVRWGPGYESVADSGESTPPLYPDFHAAFPDKLVYSSESSSAISTRGTYMFPVTEYYSSAVNDSSGGNSELRYVSAYELYSVDWGSSPDKVFVSMDNYTYAGGEFVWTGWDYIGEPTPYDLSRSSYFGIIDLAGNKKDRFYSYQAKWRPDFKMAHILPHWNWPDREGKVTPVHVFSAADEAELFLNGESQGRLEKADFTYRFRWDEVLYEPGELHVVTYKNGDEWATDTVKTVGEAAALNLTTDRTPIAADGRDLSFVKLEVVDSEGNMVPDAKDLITFSISGPGEIVATDNGDPTDFTVFPSLERKAFNGLALAIVRGSTEEGPGEITVTATAEGLGEAQITVETQ